MRFTIKQKEIEYIKIGHIPVGTLIQIDRVLEFIESKTAHIKTNEETGDSGFYIITTTWKDSLGVPAKANSRWVEDTTSLRLLNIETGILFAFPHPSTLVILPKYSLVLE